MKETSIPELELKILQVLWKIKEKTSVQDIIDSWPDPAEPGYTTILKKLQIMEKKGLVYHKKAGRAYLYYPLKSKSEVSQNKLKTMIDSLFQGDRIELFSAFLANNKLDPEEISRIKQMIDNYEEKS